MANAKIFLNTPYFPQGDGGIPGQAWRMCFSSSNAMCVEYFKPGTLDRVEDEYPQLDDKYLDTLRSLHSGDTTEYTAQLATLKHFGINAEYKQNLTWNDVFSQLEKGKPVPIGILHHGPLNAPYGGHWIVIIGVSEDRKTVYVNDPAGDLDLVNGGYLTTRGYKGAKYSIKNLDPRWEVQGKGTGWGIIFK